MMHASEVGPDTCPKCGAATLVPVVFGFPGPDMFDDADAGRIVLGGCCIDESDPPNPRECTTCGARA